MGNIMDILMGTAVALLGNFAIFAMSVHIIWGA